jgi:D-xylose transport system substrate-binding protein
MKYFVTALLLAFAAMCFSCTPSSTSPGGPTAKKIRIGFSMDALKQERWQKDRDLFLKRAGELGAEVLLQTADGSDDAQMKQVESLLTQGIDVLVIVPHNAEVAGAMVEMARKQGVPVISSEEHRPTTIRTF